MNGTIACTNATSFYERKIGKTTYRISSIYLGETYLKESLERLAVRKVLEEMNADAKTKMRA